ncbi:MAG: hypothetical protein GY861_12800 [bacterium]|nr:hypothetical protein [bacterium]
MGKLPCPECCGDGWYIGTGTYINSDGEPEPEPIQIQCEYCYGTGEIEFDD